VNLKAFPSLPSTAEEVARRHAATNLFGQSARCGYIYVVQKHLHGQKLIWYAIFNRGRWPWQWQITYSWV